MKRTLRKILRKFGYDLKKFNEYYLLPIKNISISPHSAELKAATVAFDGNSQETLPESLDKLVVYLRTCLRENRNVDKTPRFYGLSLEEGTYRCVRSLIQSINEAVQKYPERSVSLILMDDRSEPSALDNLNAICSELKCPWELRTTKTTGQGESLYEQFCDGRKQKAICYFVEDDFLHEPSAIWEMWDFYRHIYATTGGHLMIHPQEGKEMYGNALGAYYYPSYLIKTDYRRWRTMNNATHVLFTSGEVVDQYWRFFENTRFVGHPKKRNLGSESRTTNLVFSHIPGFAPIPAVAVHMQFEEMLPPFYDWKPLWDKFDAAPMNQGKLAKKA